MGQFAHVIFFKFVYFVLGRQTPSVLEVGTLNDSGDAKHRRRVLNEWPAYKSLRWQVLHFADVKS